MDNNSSENTTAKEPIAAESTQSKISKLPAVPILAGLFLIIIILAGVFYFYKSHTQVNSSTVLAEAQKQANAGNFTKSQAILKAGLSQNPNDKQLLGGIVSTYSQEGNQTGTEKQQLVNSQSYIDQLNKVAPRDISSLLTNGYAYEAAGDYQNALTYYTKATQIDPKSAYAWFRKGHVEAFLNQLANSKQDYATAYSLDPKNPYILMVRGNQFIADGNSSEAFKAYQSAAQNSQGNLQTQSEALAAASWIRRSQDNYSHVGEAANLAKQALDANPHFSPALAAYGNAIFLQNRIDDGISYLKQAIDANPRISSNYADLGMLLRGQKNYNGSINSLQQAILKVPNDNTLVTDQAKQNAIGYYTYELALSYSISGQNENVPELLSKALNLNPSLKTQLLYDYQKRGFFKAISANPTFTNLISP